MCARVPTRQHLSMHTTPLLLPTDCKRHAAFSHLRTDAAAVLWLLFEEGRLDVLADSMAALAARDATHGAAGQLLGHLMCTGRGQLVSAATLQLLAAGRAAEAAAALGALRSAGKPSSAARLAASLTEDAVEAGAIEALADAHALLWQQGCGDLLADAVVAAAHHGSVLAAASVWQAALERGHTDIVAGVMAALMRQGAAEEGAQLAAQLAMRSNYSRAAVEASKPVVLAFRMLQLTVRAADLHA